MPEPDATSVPEGASGPGPSDAGAVRPDSSFDRLESMPPMAHDARLQSSPTPAVAGKQLTRRGRVRKWDRPKPPMDWRWWVGNLGKTLIAAGLLMFGFVAYQLWGTGIETARSQNQLESEFDALLADVPTPIVTVAPGSEPGNSDPAPEPAPETTIPADGAETDPLTTQPEPNPALPVETVPPVPVEQQIIPALVDGAALARLEIPRLGRSDIVVAGVSTGDLKRGPGHFPDTPLPGQLGNAAIAGHRTTYGAPFFDVDDLQIGDDLIATTLNGTFTYRVTGSEIVPSNRYDVVATSDPNRATLTLISCDPKYTAQKRIVIYSELVASASAPVGEPVLNYGRPDEPAEPDIATEADIATGLPAEPGAEPETGTDASTPATNGTGNINEVDVGGESATLEAGQVTNEIVDAFSDGWFSDPTANSQVAIWGALLSIIGIVAYAISRKLRRDWAGALIGVLPFVVTLYFFFQNVNRLLPPNL